MIFGQTPSRARAPRGFSLIGLMFWAIVIGFIGYVAVRVLPTVNEYLTIQRAVNRVASESPATVAEVRKAFEKQKDIEYAISSISGKDLEITKENERLVIRFAYDKEIPLVEPVFLLVKYQGRSK
jgi:Tfp pilus assembly major pilin PilA